jgi:DNA modification methylase
MNFNRNYRGDCFDLIKELPDDSIDLIVTSPPYGNQRISTYGGIDPDHYVEWFMPLSQQLYRVLKPTGSSRNTRGFIRQRRLSTGSLFTENSVHRADNHNPVIP